MLKIQSLLPNVPRYKSEFKNKFLHKLAKAGERDKFYKGYFNITEHMADRKRRKLKQAICRRDKKIHHSKFRKLLRTYNYICREAQ